MASEVSIANRALAHLGAAQIVSLADANESARAVAAVYDDVRDSVLRSHPWNSAATRASIAALATTPAFGYSQQYQLPSDCLRVINVLSGDGETPTPYPWTIEGQVILADESAPLLIRYVKREEDPNQYDPLLQEAIAAKLALEICERLTNSTSLLQASKLWWDEVMERAKSADGDEGSVPPFVEDDWITARYGGARGFGPGTA